MKLPGSTKGKIAKDKNSKNVPHLEIAEIVYWNTVDNEYQHDSRVLYSFVPNITFGQLLDNFILKKFQFRVSIYLSMVCCSKF